MNKRNHIKKAVSILAVIIGILMMIYTGFNYATTGEEIYLGPIKIDKEKSYPLQWSPMVGFLIAVLGVVVIIRNKNIFK